jgi:hypothetical protein
MTRLAIAAVFILGSVSAAWIVVRAHTERYNANRPKTTGGRHRVGRDYSPLSPRVRQDLAPTAYAEVAIPAGPDEMTAPLRAPGGGL